MNPSRSFSLEEALYLCQGMRGLSQREMRFIADSHFRHYQHFFEKNKERLSAPSFAREAKEYARSQALADYNGKYGRSGNLR